MSTIPVRVHLFMFQHLNILHCKVGSRIRFHYTQIRTQNYQNIWIRDSEAQNDAFRVNNEKLLVDFDLIVKKISCSDPEKSKKVKMCIFDIVQLNFF